MKRTLDVHVSNTHSGAFNKESVNYESNNGLNIANDQNSSKLASINSDCITEMSDCETEFWELDKSMCLENDLSMSKFLEIKIEHDENPLLLEAADVCAENETWELDDKRTQNENISKMCFVKLERFDLEHLKTSKKVKSTSRGDSCSIYECDICGYSTTINSNFRRHMRIHNSSKPYSCEKCDYSTATKSNLDSHMATHAKKKPHQCDKCEFSTAHQSNLTKHMYIHGDKPFECGQCSFATANKTALKNHIASHGGDKPYQCDKCESSFAEKYKLERHKMIHDNARTFKCEKCEYGSTRKDTLMRHMKRKH